MGERAKWRYANEGLRISRFVDHVQTRVAAAAVNAPAAPDCVISETGLTLFAALSRAMASGVATLPVRATGDGDGRQRKVPKPE